MSDSAEYDEKHSHSIRCGQLLQRLSNNSLLNKNSAVAKNSDFSPYIDDTVTYSPADLNQHAECHQQQEDGGGVTTEWP